MTTSTRPKKNKSSRPAKTGGRGRSSGSASGRKAEAVAEQSVGIRVCALCLILVLVLASASYIPTPPAVIFIYALVAIAGSYLSYAFRNDRPRWLTALPVVGAVLLFANLFFELSYALSAGQATAVAAFVHMLAGLLALHSFDLRTRTDFSISTLIGLGLLTFLTGVARDMIFGVYVVIYTILGGMLLFYDSSSRSHEMGPSRAVAENPIAGQPVIRRLRISSLTAMLPIFLIPILTVATCFVIPKGDSVVELFVDSFRAQFPMSASMSGRLSRGGNSQSLQGGVGTDKKEGGSSYSAKGGQGEGTASSAGLPGQDGKNGGKGGAGASSGANGLPSATNPKGKGSAIPGLNGKKTEFELADIQGKEELIKQHMQDELLSKQTIDVKNAPADLEGVVLKVGSQNPTFVRRYTLDVFGKNGWTREMPVPGKALELTGKGDFDLTASSAVYVPTELPTEELTQDFRVETSLGSLLPHTWLPQVVKIDGKELRIDSDGTLKLPEPMADRTHYSITSQVPVYDLEMMRKLPAETLFQLDEDRDDELKTAEASTKLPEGLDKRLKDMAADAGGIEGNWFSKAERTAEFIRSHYHYNKRSFYEQPALTTQESSTTSAATTTEATATEAATTASVPPPKDEISKVNDFFFQSKAGNCHDFATAFALLCRAQGIPCRLVVGYQPGELNKTTGYREIRGKDTYVWTEVYIPYWNWVPFDPAPGGQLPAHQEGGNALTKFIASGLANPFGQAVNRKPMRKNGNQAMRGGNGQDRNNEFKVGGPKFNLDSKNKPKGSTFTLPWIGTIDQTQMQSMVKLIAALILGLVLLTALVIFLRQRKKITVSELVGDQQPSTMVFLEVLSDLKRYEFVKLPTETADELSERARTQFAQLADDGRHIPGELPEVVSQFMQLYTEERFGGSDNLDELHELSRRIKALAQTKTGR